MHVYICIHAYTHIYKKCYHHGELLGRHVLLPALTSPRFGTPYWFPGFKYIELCHSWMDLHFGQTRGVSYSDFLCPFPTQLRQAYRRQLFLFR